MRYFGWGWYADPPPLRAAHFDLGWHFGDLKPIRWALAHKHPTFLELALTRNGPARVLRNVRAAVIGASQWSPNRLGRTRIALDCGLAMIRRSTAGHAHVARQRGA